MKRILALLAILGLLLAAGSICAAAESGVKKGLTGLKIVLDGYTVGKMVAPYVSTIIARDIV